MIKRWIYIVLFSVCLGCGLLAGFCIHKFRLYPHRAMASALQGIGLMEKMPDYHSWAIGVYEGDSPYDLSESVHVQNPVLTGDDVTDVKADFVADPFFISYGDVYYMFFEVMNLETGQGDIGYAESMDALHWKYRQIVLDEKFHLSYPYVFEWEGEYYMIPESSNDFSVRLYKADSFPVSWKYEGRLLSGYRFIDPSILRYKDKWWLFLTTPENDRLNIYFSDELLGEWKPHPMNPVVKNNKNHARPGGRIIHENGRIYRFAQDDGTEYGRQVFAFEITTLCEDVYAERLVSEKAVIAPDGEGWNGGGMHHVDPARIGDRWIGVVDGRSR